MAEEKKGKSRKPTALKRDQQNARRNQRNRMFKSSVATAMRAFDETVAKKEDVSSRLRDLYSLMDKGVKKGVFKLNKASRVKSRLEARAKIV
jgi:small subunit ribosomal protein S20